MAINWWALGSYALALSSLTFAVYTSRKRQKEILHRQQRFEWAHVEAGIRQLCRWITREFSPDFLLAIPGAGVILTELAVIELGDTHPIFVAQQLPESSKETFPPGGVEFATAKWRYWFPTEILLQKHKNVLIIDDYAQSGDTLVQVRQTLEGLGFDPDHIKTAALISVRGLQESGKKPDFTWFWVEGHDVHMPWGHASKKVRTGIVEAT